MQQALIEHADLLCVEPVEPAHRGDAAVDRGGAHRTLFRAARGLSTIVQIVDGVNYLRGDSSTSWVCVTSATSLPSGVAIRVCQTIVRRPRCSGVASAVTRVPTGAAAMKLVLLSIVVVPAPSGRFSIVPTPPSVSANAMI